MVHSSLSNETVVPLEGDDWKGLLGKCSLQIKWHMKMIIASYAIFSTLPVWVLVDGYKCSNHGNHTASTWYIPYVYTESDREK